MKPVQKIILIQNIYSNAIPNFWTNSSENYWCKLHKTLDQNKVPIISTHHGISAGANQSVGHIFESYTS